MDPTALNRAVSMVSASFVSAGPWRSVGDGRRVARAVQHIVEWDSATRKLQYVRFSGGCALFDDNICGHQFGEKPVSAGEHDLQKASRLSPDGLACESCDGGRAALSKDPRRDREPSSNAEGLTAGEDVHARWASRGRVSCVACLTQPQGRLFSKLQPVWKTQAGGECERARTAPGSASSEGR
ncbi:hypothetical protein BD626DRAFT_476637 [Schizophyllum amplum]|uniref:Uncharacterized protein n=1 Tax=Schizophyllum amplum TaxID=97359 RepID=A0A550CZJ0_9AGAR|nr:hypothetical protein BD626DRAFT_476637 [Auriculariopsis ampla]